MRNSHAGICYRCGETVPAGAGHFERTSAAHRSKWPGRFLPKWLVQHADCAIRYRGTSLHYEYDPDAEKP